MLQFNLIISVVAILAIPILAIASFIGNGNKKVYREERNREEEKRREELASRVFHD